MRVLAITNQCEYKPDTAWLRRRRPDSSPYSIKIHVGERCPNEAIVTAADDRHWCLEHLGSGHD